MHSYATGASLLQCEKGDLKIRAGNGGGDGRNPRKLRRWPVGMAEIGGIAHHPWAIARDIIGANPGVSIERPGGVGRGRRGRIRLRSHGGGAVVHRPASRGGGGMREVEIDTGNTVWTLPADRTKNKLSPGGDCGV